MWLSKYSKYLILGVFLIIWAMNAYFIFGNKGKYASLVIGFLLICFGVFKIKKTRKFLFFFFISTSVYILYLLVGHWNEQQTLEPLTLTFSFVCLILLNTGFLYGKCGSLDFKLENKYLFVFPILVIAGSLAFYFNQITFFNSTLAGSRDIGDENLNPVGIAYINSLLVIFLFWLIRQSDSKILRLIIFFAAFTSLMVVIATLSRGALIFLICYFIIFYLRDFKFKIRQIVNLLSFILLVGLFIISLHLIGENSEFISSKLDAISDRFMKLVGFTTNNQTDLSSMARQEKYQYFFKNFQNFYFGEFNYKPYPHNQFLEIYMRWGLFGLPLIIFSIIMFIKSIKLFKRNILSEHPLLFLIISLFIFSYLQSMTSMSLEMNRLMWFGFGFLFGQNEEKKLIIM